MQGIAAILTGFFVAAAAIGCSGRARRPVVTPAPTGPGVATSTQNSGGIPPQTSTDESQSTTTTDSSAGGQADGAIDAPPAPDADAGEDTAATGGGDAPLRIATTLEDGTQVYLEWDGKSMQGNDKFDVVHSQ
jgi:hypothetical protein